jgi:phosphocarrier protein
MQFVDVANQFTSRVTVYKGGDEPGEADGKSVMQMIILAATEGTPLRIEASGEDAEQAVQKLAELIENKFGEE